MLFYLELSIQNNDFGYFRESFVRIKMRVQENILEPSFLLSLIKG